MGFWNLLFGSDNKTSEQQQAEEISKKFDLFKYDGVKALKMGQVDYAVKCFTEALNIKEDAETLDYLAQAYLRQGLLEESLAQLDKLTVIVPGNVGVWLQKARIAYMLEDYETMSIHCSKVIEIDAGNAVAHMMQGQAKQAMGDSISAIVMYTKAITLDEQLGEAYLLRSRLLLAIGDVVSADKDVSYLQDIIPDNEDVLMLKAHIEYAKGNKNEAINIYSNVIELNPFNADAYKERGRVKFEIGDTNGAKSDVEKLLELMPDALSDINGDYSAEGIEHKVKQAYSMMNPYGIWK